jgi:hemerythrin-like metal-binding protein
MPLFAWKPEYSVENDALDGHHKKLFDLINRLQTAMLEGHGKRVIDATLTELLQYVQYHFSAEENLMAAANYPALAEHKAQHEALTAKVREFKQEYDAGRAVVTIHVLQFLGEWLKNHLLGADRAYAPHLGRMRPLATS